MNRRVWCRVLPMYVKAPRPMLALMYAMKFRAMAKGFASVVALPARATSPINP
ncbi:hypothetical protein [Variovorax sp. LG9.2]|uniref:hypothetical protein n=1 Tax=Variovorax sp. LG9.2 TaxID=3048626 RepID=UPI002B222AB1|nr:hypothetical protein [Variovorax sp. LG9.2]MEB0058811.1 hypothetical protein [Variovorax sp. LG9.2]